MSNYQEYELGDWVRFYRDGLLVIGEVRYIRKDKIGRMFLSTDQGEVNATWVVERRSLADYIKGDE